jgi:hypothetical protein
LIHDSHTLQPISKLDLSSHVPFPQSVLFAPKPDSLLSILFNSSTKLSLITIDETFNITIIRTEEIDQVVTTVTKLIEDGNIVIGEYDIEEKVSKLEEIGKSGERMEIVKVKGKVMDVIGYKESIMLVASDSGEISAIDKITREVVYSKKIFQENTRFKFKKINDSIYCIPEENFPYQLQLSQGLYLISPISLEPIFIATESTDIYQTPFKQILSTLSSDLMSLVLISKPDHEIPSYRSHALYIADPDEQLRRLVPLSDCQYLASSDSILH